MQTLFIKNRKEENICIQIDIHSNQRGIMFYMHGLGGVKEQGNLLSSARAFREKGFSTIGFDATNSFGESDGNYENATTTNYYQDLEDVIKRAKGQSRYQEPFAILGISTGAMCIMLYAENFPEKINLLIPIGISISGESMKKNYGEILKNWKETGRLISQNKSKPGLIKRLKYDFITDGEQYNILDNIDEIKSSTLLIVGENDTVTPVSDHQIVFGKLDTDKELFVVKGADHYFREQHHIDELHDIIYKWLTKK